jgi:hypothetical protein
MLYPFELRAHYDKSSAPNWNGVEASPAECLPALHCDFSAPKAECREGSADGFRGCEDRLRVTADRQKGDDGALEFLPDPPRQMYRYFPSPEVSPERFLSRVIRVKAERRFGIFTPFIYKTPLTLSTCVGLQLRGRTECRSS